MHVATIKALTGASLALSRVAIAAVEPSGARAAQDCARVSLGFFVLMFIALAFITRQASRPRGKT